MVVGVKDVDIEIQLLRRWEELVWNRSQHCYLIESQIYSCWPRRRPSQFSRLSFDLSVYFRPPALATSSDANRIDMHSVLMAYV